ncbi:C45 family autoproteolytic acyltransferase/hydolase [Radiobacillus deserti]|uniref:Linear amide C-N hydrolase n=1 Tax=Radiobacillus deserti TaxID=2594883 RepID=A0A516KE18_9BACI|nr:C45 family peptidase [Radiobacillus deserti]QDP39556.1 linear amide C-N hydrolase [Radiobacillus deserti]
MIQVYSDVISFRGSHYDFGYKQGELLKDSPILPNRNKQWASRKKRHFVVNEERAIKLLTKFLPGIMDELQGLADALGWKLEDALKEFGGYYVEYGRSGCSILTGPTFFIRNYDSRPDSYEGRYVLYQPSDGGYATIGPSMQITGRMDGMNEKGLTMGYNFINRIKSDDGFVCNMIGRIILEACANVDEAIEVLKEIPHRTSFSYALLDASGKSVVVEASPRSVVARDSNISTNHFEMLTEENRYRMDDSIRRQNLLQAHRKGNINQAFQMLNRTDNEVFSKKYGAWSGTLHTAAYAPEERKTWFAIGADRMPVIFDFNRFLQGEKMNVKRIKGELDYHTPFINMELL